jgi:hypothetical protein
LQHVQREGLVMSDDKPPAFSVREREVFVLKAFVECIDSIVNQEVLTLSVSTASCRSATHQKFFNAVLADLIGSKPASFFGMGPSYLIALESVCDAPSFDERGSVTALREATKIFSAWLDEEPCIDGVWLPTINLELSLRIKRREAIEVCGNIAKHNFTRLTKAARDIKRILERNGRTISLEDALLVFEEFFEWFHEDILTYDLSTITEQLNNIRWGLYTYLRPHFRRAYVQLEGIAYRFEYPEDVTNNYARTLYWDLMNDMRHEPYIPRFTTDPILKLRY